MFRNISFAVWMRRSRCSAIWLRFLKHKLEGNRELAVAKEYIVPGSVVLDVGARRGVYTWVMSRAVGASGRVLAFEPNPVNATSLRRIFLKHGNVQIEECALSEASGTGVLNVPVEDGVVQDSLGHVDSRQSATPGLSYEIRLRTLDELCAARPQVSFIKIDVEGHELAVLHGARATILRDGPVIFIEIEQRHTDEPVSSRFEFLNSVGYLAHFLDTDGSVRPISAFNLESMQIRPCNAGHRFVNMFLFTPGDRHPL